MRKDEHRRQIAPIGSGAHTVEELATLLADGHDWKDVARLWGMRPIAGRRDLYWDALAVWEDRGCPGGPTEEPSKTPDYDEPEWDAWRHAREVAFRAWLTELGGKVSVTLDRTPDGHPQLWLLYRPEPHTPGGVEEREMNLWVRRCDVFSSRERATIWLERLLGEAVAWSMYDPIFGELWVGKLGRQRWWLVPAVLDPPGRDA